jgi:hypothetical protein
LKNLMALVMVAAPVTVGHWQVAMVAQALTLVLRAEEAELEASSVPSQCSLGVLYHLLRLGCVTGKQHTVPPLQRLACVFKLSHVQV